MKIGMYAGLDNGPVKDRSIDYIAIDNGLEHLHNQGIKPLFAIGDFDSLQNQSLLDEVPHTSYSSIKDDTDTALAIQYARDHGYDTIDLYGVIGGRMDHFLGVMAILECSADLRITLYDTVNKIYRLETGLHKIDCSGYHYFSVFAIEDGHLSLKNCHYPLHDYLLKKQDPLCVSNQCEGVLTIENDHPVIFIQTDEGA